MRLKRKFKQDLFFQQKSKADFDTFMKEPQWEQLRDVTYLHSNFVTDIPLFSHRFKITLSL
jgi:hypothetical protein